CVRAARGPRSIKAKKGLDIAKNRVYLVYRNTIFCIKSLKYTQNVGFFGMGLLSATGCIFCIFRVSPGVDAKAKTVRKGGVQ
ncbi:MAG: hypothetical protein PHX45_06435, partial [Acidobacteriota bacterium]|nr:hypothetical protein [Acidobacteriota bacterium]